MLVSGEGWIGAMRELFYVVSAERYVSGMRAARGGPVARCVSSLTHLSLSLSLLASRASR